jgi:hypothetical protein
MGENSALVFRVPGMRCTDGYFAQASSALNAPCEGSIEWLPLHLVPVFLTTIRASPQASSMAQSITRTPRFQRRHRFNTRAEMAPQNPLRAVSGLSLCYIT